MNDQLEIIKASATYCQDSVPFIIMKALNMAMTMRSTKGVFGSHLLNLVPPKWFSHF